MSPLIWYLFAVVGNQNHYDDKGIRHELRLLQLQTHQVMLLTVAKFFDNLQYQMT